MKTLKAIFQYWKRRRGIIIPFTREEWHTIILIGKSPRGKVIPFGAYVSLLDYPDINKKGEFEKILEDRRRAVFEKLFMLGIKQVTKNKFILKHDIHDPLNQRSTMGWKDNGIVVI